MNSLSKRAVADSPSVHVTEGESPAHCDALRPISINMALSEKLRSAITGDKYNVRCHNAKEALQVLLFLGCTNDIGVAIISPHLSQGHCG